MEKMCRERFFSIELESKMNLKNLTLTNDAQENVLIEGTLGKLQHASFVETEILEVLSSCGVLRLNVRKNEIAARETVKKSVGGEKE